MSPVDPYNNAVGDLERAKKNAEKPYASTLKPMFHVRRPRLRSRDNGLVMAYVIGHKLYGKQARMMRESEGLQYNRAL